MNKFAVFFRKYGHKILTFLIGLAFLSACAFFLVMGGIRVYRMFEPENIYEKNVDPALISSSAPFDELKDSGLKEGSDEYFEQYIANFVRQNFPGFTDPLALDTDYFISYGIWQAIKVNGQGVYAQAEDGSFRVPKEDVEKYARYSFEYAGKFENRTVDICGKFTYDRLSGCYKVPGALEYTDLVPKVLDVEYDKEAMVYTVLVDCYYSDGLTEEDVTENSKNFAKRLSITLQKSEEIQELDGEEVIETQYRYTSCALVDETVSE